MPQEKYMYTSNEMLYLVAGFLEYGRQWARIKSMFKEELENRSNKSLAAKFNYLTTNDQTQFAQIQIDAEALREKIKTGQHEKYKRFV